MNECQVFKVDFLDTFLDSEEGVVKEVGMGVTEYPRNFVGCGDVALCGCVWTEGFWILS